MGIFGCLIAPFRTCFGAFKPDNGYTRLKCRLDEELTPEGNPLPDVIHKVIRRSELGKGRLVIVGDVHGCLSELFQLLDALEFRYGHDNLLLTGDMCNKGPRPQEVVAAVRALSEGPVWVVRGNNDDGALAAYWEVQAGLMPSKKKHRWVGQLLPEDVDFLTQLPFSLRVEGYNVVVVHAGVLPGVPVWQQDLATCTTMRDVRVNTDGSLTGLERACTGSQAWAGFWKGGFRAGEKPKADSVSYPHICNGPEHVIFGHDSARRLQGYDYCTGIDTACCSGGQLTAVVLPPLAQLQNNPQFVRDRKNNRTPSLRDMGGFRVSVPSGTNIEG